MFASLTKQRRLPILVVQAIAISVITNTTLIFLKYYDIQIDERKNIRLADQLILRNPETVLGKLEFAQKLIRIGRV